MDWCRQAKLAITWPNVDPNLCRHMAYLDHDEKSQVAATNLCISGICTQSSNNLQWLDFKIRYQDGSPSDGRQDDMPC